MKKSESDFSESLFVPKCFQKIQKKMEKSLDEMEIAPVIIEELESGQDVNMEDFVEASALEIHEVEMAEEDIEVSEEEDSTLTLEEEDKLTKQFLNGELTFSEYSSRMDPEIDADPDAPKPEVR